MLALIGEEIKYIFTFQMSLAET